MENPYEQSITLACEQLGIKIAEAQMDKLLRYLGLMYKWNKTYNLSAIREESEMLKKHILDSLSILPIVQECTGLRFADIGTGAGLPGIPLAIMLPYKQFTLVDSVGKKTRFLQHVAETLKLENVKVVNERVESIELPDAEKFDVMMSRAFSSIETMIKLCENCIADEGRFYLMKGQDPETEIKALPPTFKMKANHSLRVPGIEGQRCLIIVEHAGPKVV